MNINKIQLSTLSSLIVLAFIIPQISFAAACTQSGSTAYCTDTTGNTTTYNQYGNSIYGSDGTTYTTYGDTTYGSGNVFNTGGNSGSSLPAVSAAGADLKSPEMIAAQAKYDAACAPSTSNEVIIGGTHANNCQAAVVEWLRALSNSQKSYTPPRITHPMNNTSVSSAPQQAIDPNVLVCGANNYLKSTCKEGTVAMCDGDLKGVCQPIAQPVNVNATTNSNVVSPPPIAQTERKNKLSPAPTTGSHKGGLVPYNYDAASAPTPHANPWASLIDGGLAGKLQTAAQGEGNARAASDNANVTVSTSTTANPPKKSVWRKILDWFKWW